jgi:amino acid permease
MSVFGFVFLGLFLLPCFCPSACPCLLVTTYLCACEFAFVVPVGGSSACLYVSFYLSDAVPLFVGTRCCVYVFVCVCVFVRDHSVVVDESHYFTTHKNYYEEFKLYYRF